MIRIKEISFDDFQPFWASKLVFPASSERGSLGEVHLFTGPNGTGKSRLLAALALSMENGNWGPTKRFPNGVSSQITDSNGDLSTVTLNGALLKAKISLVGKDRLGFAFSGTPQLVPSALEILKSTAIPGPQERLTFGLWGSTDLNQRIVNLTVQAAMEHLRSNDPDHLKNEGKEGDGRFLSIAKRIEKSVSDLTGVRFSVVTQTHPKLSLKFQLGNQILPIEGLPEGLNGLLSWMFAAATVMEINYQESSDPLRECAVFFLDEPETHLHPEWQRKVLPMAQQLFPNSQFFVATHSPFIVSSLNEGFIYKFEPDEHGKVTVLTAEAASKGDSYATALSEILGVNEWFDPESEKMMAEFRTLRDGALKGSKSEEMGARSLAENIASRSQELANIMGMELRQMDRLLSPSAPAITP